MTIRESRIKPLGSRTIGLTLLAALVVISFLCLKNSKSSYSVFNRTWGFDNPMFYSVTVRIAVLTILLLFLIPAFSDRFTKTLIFLSEKIKTGKLVLSATAALLAFVFFYTSQVKYHLLGDFHLRMEQAMRKEFISTEYLTMFTLHHLANFAAGFGIGTETFFRTYSCVMGSLFVFFAAMLAHEVAEKPHSKLLAFLSITASSSLLLFCGYVEIYSSPALLLLVYTYTCFLFLNSKCSFFVPVLTLALAIASHLINAAAIPSLLVALYWREQSSFPFIKKLTHKKIALIVTLLTIFALLIVFNSKSSFVMPFKKIPNHISFLSFKHVWEFINGQVLCSGLNLFVVIILLIRAAVEKIRLEKEHYFLLGLAGPLLLLVLISDLQRGSGDWDIMSFPSFSINLLCFLLCLHILRDYATYLILFLLAFNGINALLWINIHHTEKTAYKVESMYRNDPASYYQARISGKIQLGLIFKENKMYDHAQRVAREACAESGNNDVRACLIYAEALRRDNKNYKAAEVYEWLLNGKAPAIYEAYLFLLEYFEMRRETEKVAYYLRKLYESFVADPEPFLHNGNFNPNVMADLMNVHYKYHEQLPDTSGLSKIRYLSEQLRTLQQQPNETPR